MSERAVACGAFHLRGLIWPLQLGMLIHVLTGGAEELDIVRLLLQPIQLGAAGCIVYGQYCSFAFVAITLLLPWLFFALQSVSSYIYNSRCNRFHVETCKHVNPIMQHNGHSFCYATIVSKQLTSATPN